MFRNASVTGQPHAVVRFLREQEGTFGRSSRDSTRVRRTQRRLRDAIVSLIHEKSYPAIAVKEILVRGRRPFGLLRAFLEQRRALGQRH